MDAQTADAGNATSTNNAGAPPQTTQNSLLNGGGTSDNAAPANAGNINGADQSNVSSANGTGETQAGQNGDNQQQTNGNGGEVDWRHEFARGFDDEGDRTLWLNESARAQSKEDFAKQYVGLRKRASNSITIPADDDADGWNDVYSKLGRPEDPDKYQLNWDGPEPLTESEQAGFEEFKQVHYRNGGTQKQLDDYAKWESQQRRVQAEAWRVKAEDQENENIQTNKASWGNDFDRNVKVYNNTAQHMFGDRKDEFANLRLADGTLVSNHPIIAQGIVRMGLERVNDDFDYSPMNASRKQDAVTALENKKQELIKEGITPSHPRYPREEMSQLARAAAATRPRTPNDRFRRPSS